MFSRLRDKIPAVRAQAVLALSRLQNPEDPDCTIMQVFCSLIEYDSSKDVRKVALESLCLTSHTTEAFLSRRLDERDEIRQRFYIVCAKQDPHVFSPQQKSCILWDGLRDRYAKSLKS